MNLVWGWWNGIVKNIKAVTWASGHLGNCPRPVVCAGPRAPLSIALCLRFSSLLIEVHCGSSNSAPLIFLAAWFSLVGGGSCPVHCRVCHNNPDLYSLMPAATSAPPNGTTKNGPRHFQVFSGDKIAPALLRTTELDGLCTSWDTGLASRFWDWK